MFPTRGRSFMTLKARVLCVYRTLPTLPFVRLGSAASFAEKTRKIPRVVREFSPRRLRASDRCAQSVACRSISEKVEASADIGGGVQSTPKRIRGVANSSRSGVARFSVSFAHSRTKRCIWGWRSQEWRTHAHHVFILR